MMFNNIINIYRRYFSNTNLRRTTHGSLFDLCNEIYADILEDIGLLKRIRRRYTDMDTSLPIVKHKIQRYDSMISKNHAILNRLHVYKFSINYSSLRRISQFNPRYHQKIDMPCNQNLKYSSIFSEQENLIER